MTSLEEVAAHLPSARIPIGELSDELGLSAAEMKVYRRFYGLAEVCREPGGTLTDLTGIKERTQLEQSIAVWRWNRLLRAQHIEVEPRRLTESIWVSMFFNNFLPSNIGGDVIRISDTARRTRSKTLATTIVLVDRGLGVLGLVLVAAVSATIVGQLQGHVPSPIWPVWLWAAFAVTIAVAVFLVWAPSMFARLLKPLTAFNPAWVGERIEKLTKALERFRDSPGALAECFIGALCVQALLIVYHLAVVYALNIPIGIWDLAIIVPLSSVVQMVPVSLNGFGSTGGIFAGLSAHCQ